MMLDDLDSTIAIYHYDHTGSFQHRATRWMASLLRAGHQFAISDLVRMECRVGPLRSGRPVMLATFDAFFANPDLRTIPLTASVFDRAAEIRASHGFKTPDAVHLAAAVESGCDRFLTHDLRLARFAGIGVEVLP